MKPQTKRVKEIESPTLKELEQWFENLWNYDRDTYAKIIRVILRYYNKIELEHHHHEKHK